MTDGKITELWRRMNQKSYDFAAMVARVKSK
jgi:hypothetical protein